MRQLTYRVLLNREPEGGYTVTVPTLPGCVTYGENVEEALLMAKEAIGLYIESLVAHDEKVPDESNILEYAITKKINISPVETRHALSLPYVLSINYLLR